LLVRGVRQLPCRHQNCDGSPTNACEVTSTACVTPYPYTPRNFNPAGPGINPAATNGTTTLNCGTSTFDSNTLTFGNWCSQPTPVPVVQTQPGGADVVVLPLVNFTIAAGATLRLTGTRPVILAAFGNATLAGTIDGSANGTTPGAGGNQACSPGRAATVERRRSER